MCVHLTCGQFYFEGKYKGGGGVPHMQRLSKNYDSNRLSLFFFFLAIFIVTIFIIFESSRQEDFFFFFLTQSVNSSLLRLCFHLKKKKAFTSPLCHWLTHTIHKGPGTTTLHYWNKQPLINAGVKKKRKKSHFLKCSCVFIGGAHCNLFEFKHTKWCSHQSCIADYFGKDPKSITSASASVSQPS